MAITEKTLPPTVALAGNPMWVGLETDEYAEDFIGLHLDPEVYLDGAWESASQETRHEPDSDHKVVVDISDILSWEPVKEFSFPDLALIVKRNDLRRQWRLFRSEKYGNPLAEYNDDYAAGTRYILPGKISDIRHGQINDYYSNWWTKLQFEKIFLTNAPRTKKTDASADERLYYLVFGTSVTSINLQIKVYYTDGTDTTVTKETISSVSQYDIYEIVSSYKSLALAHATKVVSKYDVWLVDQADNVISEVFTFKFVAATRDDARYYIFRNAYGMYEGARLSEVSEDSDEIDFITALRKKAKDYSASDMTLVKELVKEAHNVKAYSEWLSEDELAWIREIVLSREVYEVVDGVLRPILITTSSMDLNRTNSNLRAISIDYIYGYDSVPDVPDVAYYPQQFVHATDEKVSPNYTFGYTIFTMIYHYNNKSYVALMQRQESGYDSRATIFAFDHTTNKQSANYDLKATGEITGATDYHPMPSVIVADDGHIIVAQEFVRLAAQSHNDAVTIKRSDNAEDETSWVNAKAQTAGYYTYIGSWQPDNSQRLAYPLLHKDTSGNIYCLCRRYTTGGRYLTIFKSEDHGVTWDAGHDIVDSGDGDIWFYANHVLTGTSDRLRFSFEKRMQSGSMFYEKVFYIESDDGGVTWRDVSSSFSKDTVASGAITLAELENAAYDFVVIEAATDTPQDNIVPRGGCIDDSGIPHILTVEWSSGTYFDYRLVYWDGSAWQKNLITDGTASIDNSGPLLVHRKDTIFDLYFEESTEVLVQYRTMDLVNWEKVRTVASLPALTTNTFRFNRLTNNFKDTDNWMMVSIYGSDAAYSDVFCEVTDGRWL